MENPGHFSVEINIFVDSIALEGTLFDSIMSGSNQIDHDRVRGASTASL